MTQETKDGFFSGASRRIILGSPTLQASTRRICVPIRMPLGADSFADMPDWIGAAYEAVARTFTEVSPEVEQIADVVLAFANKAQEGALFAAPSASVPQAELRAFSIIRAGDPDEPTVELTFKVYAPFAREFWKWLGEMAGSDVYMAFPKSLAKAVEVKPPAKSGPKDLAQFHASPQGQ